MRVRRLITRLLPALLAAVVIAGAVVYVPANRMPAKYAEALDRVGRLGGGDDPRRGFFELLGDFSQRGGAGKPFAYTVTSDEINLALASMDRIASSLPSARPLRPEASLERAGFIRPAVALDDGVLTLMVWSKKHAKALSADLEFVFDAAGRVRMEITAVRVGVLPLPGIVVGGRVRRIREKLEALPAAPGAVKGRFGPIPADRMAAFLRTLIGMLDGKPIRPEIVWNDFAAEHPLLIRDIEIADGRLTLYFEPNESASTGKSLSE